MSTIRVASTFAPYRVSGRSLSILACLLVACIWGSSMVMAKQALTHVEPLTLAGLRYFLGSLVIVPFALRRRGPVSHSRTPLLHLALVGIVAYGIGNSALFASLKFLPATTASFALGLLPLVVLLGGCMCLDERPGRLQLCGVGAGVLGMGLYFVSGLQTGSGIGLALLVIGVGGNAVRSLMGRSLATKQRVATSDLTVYPLAIGGAATLVVALMVEGVPSFTGPVWAAILWMAIVNTALAYALFNYALSRLRAFEVNVLLNLTPFVAAGLAWMLLGEVLSLGQTLGLVVVVGGAALVSARS